MKRLTLRIAPLLMAALISQNGYSQAPAPLPAEIEGPINSVALQGDGSVTMQVMNITVNVPPGTPITSPSTSLTSTQLADPAPFPGRTQEGFVGGTAIVTGTTDANGLITASDVFVEPAENVVLGVVTANQPGQIQLNNVPVSLLNDLRMPSQPVKNVFGFEIRVDSVAPGTPASAEGYFANGTFHAFLLEIDGPAQLVNPNPQISILRAQTRERTPNNQRGDEVEVRGGVTMSHLPPGVTTQNIRVFRVDNGVQRQLGDTTAVVDPLTPGFAEWRFRITTQPTNNAVLGRAPTVIRARMLGAAAGGATVDAVAEVRED